MRQLSIISSMDPKSGGPAQAIRYLFPYFEKDYSIVDVLCPIWEDSENSKLDAGLNYKFYPYTKNIWGYSKEIKNFLINHIEEYDFVIVHGLWLYNLFAVYQVIKKLKRAGVKKIPQFFAFAHGMLDPWFQKTKTRRLKAFRNVLYWYFIQEKILRSADGILFTCEEEMLLSRTTFKKYKPQNEFNTGYGIPNPPAYSSSMKITFEEKYKLEEGATFILYMGRIDEKKGLDLLVKAYHNILSSNVQNHNLPIVVIAGPGQNSDFGKKIEKYINANPVLQKYFVFVGMLTGDAKWGALYLSDAFILPSHQENFGIAVVEALACGTPVLISNKINIWREILNENGGLVEEDNLEGTTSLLVNWIGLSKESKDSIRANAISVYNKKFKIETAAHNIILAYQKVKHSKETQNQ